MHTIKKYIDDLFQNVPETEEIKRIKNDLYLNAMDRYDELINAGKSATEAFGTVIIEIGELDDLLDSLEYDQVLDLKDYSTNTLEQAKIIVSANKQAANKIGFGVLLILVGGGLVPSLGTFSLSVISIAIFLTCVAISVGLFISSGLKLESIETRLYNKEELFYLADEDYEFVEEQFYQYKLSNRYRISLGVMLCILAPIPLILFNQNQNELLGERYGVIFLTLSIGIAVFNFIQYGMLTSAYEKILNIGDYSATERRFQKQIEPIAGMYWMFVTLIYLAWGFIWNGWHLSWVVWPIGGILWGIIALFLKMRNDQK